MVCFCFFVCLWELNTIGCCKHLDFIIVFLHTSVTSCYVCCVRTICQGIRGGPGEDKETGWCRNAQASPWEFAGPERQGDHCSERGNLQFINFGMHYFKGFPSYLVWLVRYQYSSTVFYIWHSRSCTVGTKELQSPPKLRPYKLSLTWRWTFR